MKSRILAIAVSLLLPIAASVDAATFTVVNANNDGVGSLRWAIIQANSSPGPHRITFSIPGDGVQKIQVATSPLPQLNTAIAIDGTTQPGYFSAPAVAGTPLIEIDGSAFSSGPGILFASNADGSSIRGLAIGNFTGGIGVHVFFADACTVAACHIGCNAAGTVAMPNQLGINLDSATGGLVGGGNAKSRNVISGNSGLGVAVSEYSDAQIKGNFIGTNAAGTSSLSNLGGIRCGNTLRTTIGGLAPGEGNLVSGNTTIGIDIFDGSVTSGNSYRIYGNRVGTNVHGTAAIPNQGLGIDLRAAFSVVGDPQAPNVISGNVGGGIRSLGTDNIIQDNFIGTTFDGVNAVGNGADGLSVSLTGVQVLRNVIGANSGHGIRVFAGAPGLIVKENAIGTNRSGVQDLGNTGRAITIGSSNCFIGGTTPGEGNIIAFNGQGVVVEGVHLGNSIRANRLFSNDLLDLDLGGTGINANDPGDPDTGPNNLQNFPVLESVTYADGQLTVTGTLNTTPSTSAIVDIYSSPVCNSLGNGGGETWVGSTSGTTDVNGSMPILFQSSGIENIAGYSFTATATVSQPDGVHSNTSEFSPCVLLSPSVATEPPVTRAPAFALGPPRPQPARGTLDVPFALARPSRVALRAYDVAGRHVATLLDQVREAGQHRVSWSTDGIPPGVYQIRIDAAATDGSGESFKASRSVVVLH